MQTLPTNIKHNIRYPEVEFVILDYNSSDGLEKYIKQNFMVYIESGQLVYYRTNEPEKYSMSHSRNLAFKVATGDIVCNIDSDNYTGVDFAAYVNAEFQRNRNIFLSTHHQSFAKNDVLGRICVRKKDFLAVTGYDEKMIYYGFDDFDFSNRLQLLGLKNIAITDHKFLQAIEHSNNERLKNFDNNSFKKLFIRYLSPYSSKLYLLFKEAKIYQATIINNFHYNALQDSGHIKPGARRECHFNYSILEEQWQAGTYKMLKSSCVMDFNGLILRFKKVEGADGEYRSVDNSSVFLVSDDNLKEVALFFFNQISNRLIMENNWRNQIIKANKNVFGSGHLMKNFTTAIN